MLSTVRHGASVSSRVPRTVQALCCRSHRLFSRAASTSAAPDSPLLPRPADIWVLPFQQKPKLALQRMEIFSCASARSFQGIVSQVSKSILGFSIVSNPIEMTRWKAIYLPAWIWAAKVKGTAKRDASPNGNVARPDGMPAGTMITINLGSGPLISRKGLFPGAKAEVSGEGMPEEVTGSIELKDNFFPGTSISPLQYINVSVRQQIDRSLDSPVRRYDPAHVPDVFSADDLEELGSETIPAIPFDVSPLAIPEVLKRQSTMQSLPFTVSTDSLEWQKLEATPIYLPFYLANFKHNEREFTLALAATDESIGHCDMHFPPPIAPEGSLKWPAKPLGSALFPGPGLMAMTSQSSFIADIDPSQWLSQQDRDSAAEPDWNAMDDAAREAEEKTRTGALMRSASMYVLAQNVRTDADRWLDGDGVRAQLAKAAVTARGVEARGVGKLVPFVKRDMDELENEDDY